MSRNLRIGTQGDDVRAVQDVLNFHIRRLEPLIVDGNFGPKTQARVAEFQKSNSLQVDGVVGTNTHGKLFENEAVPFSLGIVPKLLLDLPKIGGPTQPPGIQPPNLIPPLVFPGQGPAPAPSPVPFLTPLQLLPASISQLPTLNSQGQILNLTLTVPSRNDPLDPAVKSFRQIVQLLETLPPNFPFRTMIIGAVPNPIKKVGDLSLGFDWGIKPLFDLKQLSGPTEFTVGAAGSASYTFGVINQGPGGLKLGFFARGDFKGELDYTSQKRFPVHYFIWKAVLPWASEDGFEQVMINDLGLGAALRDTRYEPLSARLPVTVSPRDWVASRFDLFVSSCVNS